MLYFILGFNQTADYTEKLVYIPYFVHQNDIVAEHYCVLPGTIYADVVILQSEKAAANL